jgi:chromosome segregation ATPase
LNVRKEIDYNDKLLTDEKEASSKHYQELTRLRDISFNLDKDLEAQHKRIDILRVEIDNNEQRIASISDLLQNKEEAIYRCQGKISEAMQQVQDLKYTLNKLDGELGYFENQNEQHKAAQSQMFKANEYEYMQGKDHNMKAQELEIQLNKLVQDEKSVSYEIDRLKQHSDQMLKD